MERIKDFFHDFSDVFFAIVVASVMFVVLSWNLGSWFDNSSNTVLADGLPSIVEESNDESLEEKDKEEVVNEDEVVVEVKKDDTQITDQPKAEDPAKPTVEEPKTDEKPIENNNAQGTKKITVPNGTPGTGVAKILKENGLIEDTNDFIKTAEDLKLAVKLKSGSFEIPIGTTIEDMVRIIAGQKKL